MLARALLHLALDPEKEPRAFLGSAAENYVNEMDVDNHEALVELLLAKPPELYYEAENSFRIRRGVNDDEAHCGKCEDEPDEADDSDGSVDDDEYRRMLEGAPEDRSQEFLHGTPEGSEASATDRYRDAELDAADHAHEVAARGAGGAAGGALSIPGWCEEVD